MASSGDDEGSLSLERGERDGERRDKDRTLNYRERHKEILKKKKTERESVKGVKKQTRCCLTGKRTNKGKREKSEKREHV